MLFENLLAIIPIYLTFNSRESEEIYFQNYGRYARIHYSRQSSSDEFLLQLLFAFDHDFITFDDIIVDVNFLVYIVIHNAE